jgi:hypothetical protein
MGGFNSCNLELAYKKEKPPCGGSSTNSGLKFYCRNKIY